MGIFDIIIAPFLLLIKHTFLFAYALTGNHGYAIVLLSLAISVLLLPIFIFIEKAKMRDDVVKRKMKPLIDEVKRCYSGQERYYYLQTINRQHNYSPVKALIPILSLLIQIPFFIAAYQFLESYEPLVGKSFWFINNLSAPDALLDHINVLPIAMTVINLLTAYFYTRNGNTEERKQMAVVAGIFLVLLFKLPAGLVLYWTLNNLFSFLRLFITNPEVFKQQKKKSRSFSMLFSVAKEKITAAARKIKYSFLVISIVSVVFLLNSIQNLSMSAISTSIAMAVLYGLGGVLFVIVLILLHNTQPLNKTSNIIKQLWPSFKTSFYFFLVLLVTSQVNWALQYSFNTIIQRLAIALIGSAVTTAVIALIVLFYHGRFNSFTNGIVLKVWQIGKTTKLYFIVSLVAINTGVLAWYFSSKPPKLLLNLAVANSAIWLIFVLFINLKSTLKKQNIRSFKQVLSYLKLTPKFYFSLVFLSVYFALTSTFYYSGSENTINLIGLILIMSTQLLAVIYFLRNNNIRTKSSYLLFGIALSIVLLVQLLWTIDCVLLNKLYPATYFANKPTSLVLLFGALFAVISLPLFIKYKKLNFNNLKTPQPALFSISLVYILSLVFFWSPLIVYSSFPETFSFPAVQVLLKNLPAFVISLFGAFAVYLILPKSIKHIFAILATLIVFMFFINSFIAPINVGSLQLGKYIKADNLAQNAFVYLAEAIILIIGFIWISKLIAKKHASQITAIIAALLLILITQSLIKASSDGEFFRKEASLIKAPSNISFSKNQQNIVYIIPDMFMGMHMKYILDEDPELKEVFEGFTWYPNTLSVSTNTCPSISALHSGAKANIDKLNRDNIATMEEKITAASEEFVSKAKAKGYGVTSTHMVYSKIDKKLYDAYLPDWHTDWNKWNNTLNIGGAKELDYSILWKNAVFYGAPHFLKARIYNHGKWIRVEKETNKNTKLSKRCNFIRLLPFISDTLNHKKSFVYIHSEATHGPWNIVDDEGKLEMDVSSYKNQKWFIYSFVKWIKWMKVNGVYDNTKIIMLSDHSHYLPKDELENFGGKFKWGKEGQKKLSAKDFWRVNALLMVKDFNTTGSLKEDWRLMSNADAPAITFDENDPTKGEKPNSRTLPVFFVDHGPRQTAKTSLDIRAGFWVKDSVYNPDNWTKMKQ